MTKLEIEKLIYNSKTITTQQAIEIFGNEREVHYVIEERAYCCDILGFCDNGYLVFVTDHEILGLQIKIYESNAWDRESYKLIESSAFVTIRRLYSALIERGMFPYP